MPTLHGTQMDCNNGRIGGSKKNTSKFHKAQNMAFWISTHQVRLLIGKKFLKVFPIKRHEVLGVVRPCLELGIAALGCLLVQNLGGQTNLLSPPCS